MNRYHEKTPRRLAIAVAILMPTIVTWVYFHLLVDHPMQKTAYSTGKLVQFSLPLVWVCLFLKQSLRHAGLMGITSVTATRPVLSRSASIACGVVMGLAVSGLMYVIYRMIPTATIAGLSSEVNNRLTALGFATPALFIGLGIFYALVHSFMEEYYFRWFIFGQLRHVASFVPAMIVSGLAFMAHHVIVLAMYFGWTPLTALLSISIAVGGMIWAWQYEKSRSLIGPWLSHLIVDAGIFVIGYDVLKTAGAFSPSISN